MKNTLVTLLFVAIALSGCMKIKNNELVTDDGGDGGGGGNINRAGTIVVKTGIQYYGWLKDSLKVTVTADANPVDAADNQTLIQKYSAVMDRLPGNSKVSALTPGAHLAAFGLSAEFMNRFITEDLNRAEAQRLVLKGFAVSGNNAGRTFAPGVVMSDAQVRNMTKLMNELLFMEEAPESVIRAALQTRDEMLQGIAAPTAQQNREVALAIFAAQAAGPQALGK